MCICSFLLAAWGQELTALPQTVNTNTSVLHYTGQGAPIYFSAVSDRRRSRNGAA